MRILLIALCVISLSGCCTNKKKDTVNWETESWLQDVKVNIEKVEPIGRK